MKRILLLLFLCAPGTLIFPQAFCYYFSPMDTTINAGDTLTVYGRLDVSGIPSAYGITDTNYTAKLLISKATSDFQSSDPRINPTYKIDASLDGYVNGAGQYEAVIGSIPPGSYNFCYGYYLHDTLYWFSGADLNTGLIHFGQLNVNQATGIEAGNQTAAEYQLYQNYPNPFNPATMIRFAVPKESHVILNIYNTLGQKLETLFDKEMKAGVVNVSFDGSSLSSGVYFYKLTAGSFVRIRKMLLLK